MTVPHDAPTLWRVVKAHKRINALVGQRFGALGIHPGQDRLLSELWAEDGLSQSELIERLGVEPPTVTGTVQRLEREGFLRREPDERNRRISRVYLTDRGRALEQPVREALRDAEASLFAELSQEERRRLDEILDQVV